MPTTYLTHLACSKTDERHEAGQLLGLSRAQKPLLCRYDLDALARDVSRETFSSRRGGMWRWRELLPLPLDQEPVTLGEGDTALLPTPRLGKAIGVPRLLVKDESQNPTGSFKARGLSAAVTMAKYLGATGLIVPSAGNAGGAVAAYAARAGLPAHVVVPADTPIINRLEVPLFGGGLTTLDGLIDACGARAAQMRDELGAFDVSTLKEPYRIEGKKTMGLELAEQLGWRVPDVILYPTGGGTGLIGMFKAFRELQALGFIDADKLPRFVSVQAQGCAPVVRAFEQGLDHAPKWENATTSASGLRVPGAVGDFLMLQALRESGGTAIAVSEDELHEGTRHLGALEGINACPEAGACVAAARTLRASGFIGPNDEVVVFNTGAGSKYLEVLQLLYS